MERLYIYAEDPEVKEHSDESDEAVHGSRWYEPVVITVFGSDAEDGTEYEPVTIDSSSGEVAR